ncbi:MAG: hypothetical protein PHC97_04400 [Patescibacteria group bacterium]|nr:hypothetical protein [Patescibacteria group bacterium]
MDLFKEAPIIIYLAIYGINSLKLFDPFGLLIAGLLTLIYLLLLYNEYKMNKISGNF